jgi:hypothetical protein
VVLSDKLHNARSIVTDHRQHGPDLWGRFRGGRDGTAWYYASLRDALAARGDAPASLLAEFEGVVGELLARAESDA